jgi:Galactose-3-O-sulfotransferase
MTGNLVAVWAASLLSAYAVAGSWWLWTQDSQPRELQEMSSDIDLAEASQIRTTQRGESRPHNATAAGNLDHLVERLSRAYQHMPALPCLEAEERWFGPSVQHTPSRNGLLFVKPYKTASSTAVGVHLRVATHLAKQQQQGIPSEFMHGNRWEMCKVRFDHAVASRMRYGERIRGGGQPVLSSLLWSIVRDPTSRAVSQYYHFVVGRHNVPATDDTFRAALSHPSAVAPRNYYLRILTLADGGYKRLGLRPPASVEDAIPVIQGIVEGYDFLAVTERFDESMVVLQLLTSASLASVMYLPAKRGGGYDDGGGKRSCVRIPSHPANLTPGMAKYLESSHWRAKVQYDQLLFRVANRSLDRTIDETIGRPVFERQLAKYVKAQRLASERCLSQTVFPCDDEGRYRNDTDCLWNDSGTYACCIVLLV